MVGSKKESGQMDMRATLMLLWRVAFWNH